MVTPTGRKMDIIRSYDNSAITPLASFWSTVVANFVTPDGFACLHPRHTLKRLQVTKPGRLRIREYIALEKYVKRGFRRVDNMFWMPLMEPVTCSHRHVGGLEAGISRFDPLGERRLPVFKSRDGWRTLNVESEDAESAESCALHHVLPESYEGILEVNVLD